VRGFENDRVLTGRSLSLERLDERDVIEQVEYKSRITSRSFTQVFQNLRRLNSASALGMG
jgi:hypothetical protein